MAVLEVTPLGPAPGEFHLDRLIPEPAQLHIMAVAHRIPGRYERRLAAGMD